MHPRALEDVANELDQERYGGPGESDDARRNYDSFQTLGQSFS
jgi:hypothetical protein